MNNQIEGMARVLNECCNIYDEQGRHIRNKCGECECWSDDNHCCCSYSSKEAEALYNAGYRKSTDVAREIFAEIEANSFVYGVNFLVSKETFAELRKKYESEGADDETDT